MFTTTIGFSHCLYSEKRELSHTSFPVGGHAIPIFHFSFSLFKTYVPYFVAMMHFFGFWRAPEGQESRGRKEHARVVCLGVRLMRVCGVEIHVFFFFDFDFLVHLVFIFLVFIFFSSFQFYRL